MEHLKVNDSPYAYLNDFARELNSRIKDFPNPMVTDVDVEYIALDAGAGTTWWQLTGFDTYLEMRVQLLTPREWELVIRDNLNTAEKEALITQILTK